MNKDRINSQQIAIMLFLVITGGKFLSLPAILSGDVGHDSWLVMVVDFAWDLLAILLVLYAIKLNTPKLSLDKVLSANITAVGSKLIHVVFFVVFISRTIVLLNSCYKMFAVTFDVNTNWVVFVLPVVAVSFFVVKLGMNSIARFGQIVVALVTVSVISLLVFLLLQADFKQLLPICEVGFNKIISTAYKRSFWFSDYMFVYFALEHYEDSVQGNKLFLPVLISFVFGAILTILLDQTFVSLYGSIAPDTDIAMSQISIFSITDVASGRWDWLTLSLWLTSVFIKITVFVYCAYKSVEVIVGKRFNKLNVWTILVITLLLMTPLFVDVDTFLNVFVSACVIPFSVVQYLLPVCMPYFTKRAVRRSVND